MLFSYGSSDVCSSDLFPSFSGAWRISEESFFAPAKTWLSEFKLRGSWGKAGMLAGEAFQYLTGYSLRGNAYAFGSGSLVQGSQVIREANPFITWRSEEHTSELQSLMRI